MRVHTVQMRCLILLLLCSSVYSARVTKKVYAIGDTSCVGTPVIQPSFYVTEIRDTEVCTNLDTNNDGMSDASLRNRYCDQSYQKYHEETFSMMDCVCLTSSAICIKEWSLGVCTLQGQIPMIVECDEWDNVLPNSVTTVVNITTHVHEGDTTIMNNITNVDNTSTHHHYNITNITRVVNESITNVIEKAVNTTITEEIWGVSEAAFFWGTALSFFGVIAVAYFVYATITANKKEELKANAMGTGYGKQPLLPRRNRIF